MRRILALMIAAYVVALAVPSQAAAPRAKLRHVWIFVFENTTYDEVTPQSMPYFSARAAEGVTLTKMYGVGHASLDNYIAMASGHAPKPKTQADCFLYDCIYERGDDSNISDQLEGAGLTWRAYMDGMKAPCPKPTEGKLDPYTDGYATRHNPFMYYRDIVGDSSRCREHVRPFAELASDRSAGKVANYSFISPDTCNDAHDDNKEHCKLADGDAWLSQQLPAILASKEYHDGGAVFLTFDEAEITDGSGCCGTPGGGHIATAILSPLLQSPGSSDATPYSHYSLLRTIEDGFGVPCLRHACDASTSSMISLFKAAEPPTTSTATPSTAGAPHESSSSGTSNTAAVVVAVVGGVAVVAFGAVLLTRRRRSS